MSWNLFGPRFGITYDLSGGGRSVVKFNYGQYWWNPSNDISTAANPQSIAVVPSLHVDRS